MRVVSVMSNESRLVNGSEYGGVEQGYGDQEPEMASHSKYCTPATEGFQFARIALGSTPKVLCSN